MENKRLCGILGGMGPEATVYFFSKIVELTLADKDQDHIPLLIYNYPQIPDRTLAYLGIGKSPLEELVRGIKKLQESGCDIIAIPCNSAHLWYKDMVEKTNAKIINMIELTVKRFKKGDKVGLLATTLTVKSKLYEEPLRQGGVEVLLPEDQEFVMNQIRLIKSGKIEKARSELLKVADSLIRRGASHILAGCTEVPLALKKEDFQIPLVDPMEIMAAECIIRLGGKLKNH